jgi:asparagine synthase (glutamine-hydrolysing)
MCGVAGAFAFGSDATPIDRAVVLRLNELQRHRGPDGTGLWASFGNRVILGHRRLAIIDTGTSGAQPMSDSSGRWTISFNGEIYNFRALKTELEQLGCVFRTNSDTEVLIHAIAQWGEAGLSKLRGMYAFALWDGLEKELWLARDPFGIKPLYVAQNHDTIWFASQARPLANTAPVDTNRDAAALTGFYLWGHVPEPFSWWAGIRMFPAGHVQRIGAGRAAAAPRAFAKIQDAYVDPSVAPLAPGELRSLVLDTVRHHLVADVPVGIFLSAGVDSNVIAALAGELGSDLRTITLAFDEYLGTADDEAPLAEASAKRLGSDHTTVRLNRNQFEELLDDFLKSMDQPTIDGLNTYLVSSVTAKQGLKVALSGLGGDELFGGYPSFRQIPRLLKWGQRIPLRKTLGGLLQRLLRAAPLPGVPPKLPGLLSHCGDIASAYLLRRALHLEDELDLLLDKSWLKEGLQRLSTMDALSETVATLRAADTRPYAQVAALETCWYMRNQLLRDTDWSSMAHGLEVRVPFVDMHLFQRIGRAIASDAPPTKSELAACAKQLPPRLGTRPKTGFNIPVQQWIGVPGKAGTSKLRGWAAKVHQSFRTNAKPDQPNVLAMAAE